MPYKNIEDTQACHKRYSKTDKYKACQKRYRTTEKYKKAQLRYRSTEKAKLNRRLRGSTERKTNPILYKMRCRICSVLKHSHKSTSTTLLVGCSMEKLKNYLQNTAEENGYTNFDINNYSGKEYHIDHIVPCSAFNLNCSYHQKLCFNWSNLQILSAKDNLIKSNIVSI